MSEGPEDMAAYFVRSNSAGVLLVVSRELARLRFAVDIRDFKRFFLPAPGAHALTGVSEMGRSMPKKKLGPASSMPLSSVCFRTECGTDWTGRRKTRFADL
jgi:hypothetical protein